MDRYESRAIALRLIQEASLGPRSDSSAVLDLLAMERAVGRGLDYEQEAAGIQPLPPGVRVVVWRLVLECIFEESAIAAEIRAMGSGKLAVFVARALYECDIYDSTSFGAWLERVVRIGYRTVRTIHAGVTCHAGVTHEGQQAA